MNGGHDRVGTHDGFLACGVSVVVDDLDALGSSVRPTEADTPLLIDTDAVGARPIALELLEPVSRRHPRIVERLAASRMSSFRNAARWVPWSSLRARSRRQTRSASSSANDRNTRHDDNARRYERRALYERPAALPVGAGKPTGCLVVLAGSRGDVILVAQPAE